MQGDIVVAALEACISRILEAARRYRRDALISMVSRVRVARAV